MKIAPVFIGWSFLLLLSQSNNAEVAVPALFSNHAVLQRAEKTPIWGSAAPGENISVSLDNIRANTKVGSDGKWRVSLDLRKATSGSHALTIEGKNKLQITDVVVGDVWVCAGQSNMEFELKKSTGAATEIANSANLMLRHFLVANTWSPVPQETLKGVWQIAGPEQSGDFTAVGYYFGKALNAKLHTPIGLIHASWGGTPAEAWISGPGMHSVAELKTSKDKYLQGLLTWIAEKKQYTENIEAWLNKNDRADRTVSSFTAQAEDKWQAIALPGEITGLAENGALWVRRLVKVPENWGGKPLEFKSGAISGADALYWNGEKVGETSITELMVGKKRSYIIPRGQVFPGSAILALRIYAPATAPKIEGPILLNDMPLQGEWEARLEFALPPVAPAARANEPQRPKYFSRPELIATSLFNAKINPLIPYAIKGVIWYQGESNEHRAYQYRTTFPLLIQDWRRAWGQGDFPFYFCQLANHRSKKEAPEESEWAEVRESQTAALALPQTGMAVLIDAGEAKDIHPRNKEIVGERLAAIALSGAYGKATPFQGPTLSSAQPEKSKIRLTFEHADGGLVAKSLPDTQIICSSKGETAPLIKPKPESELQGFSICGPDKKWHWANAKIEDDAVVVWADAVQDPIAVRYGWAYNPTCNLYNGAGFPASPFRTDHFPLVTEGIKY